MDNTVEPVVKEAEGDCQERNSKRLAAQEIKKGVKERVTDSKLALGSIGSAASPLQQHRATCVFSDQEILQHMVVIPIRKIDCKDVQEGTQTPQNQNLNINSETEQEEEEEDFVSVMDSDSDSLPDLTIAPTPRKIRRKKRRTVKDIAFKTLSRNPNPSLLQNLNNNIDELQHEGGVTHSQSLPDDNQRKYIWINEDLTIVDKVSDAKTFLKLTGNWQKLSVPLEAIRHCNALEKCIHPKMKRHRYPLQNKEAELYCKNEDDVKKRSCVLRRRQSVSMVSNKTRATKCQGFTPKICTKKCYVKLRRLIVCTPSQVKL
ncbi:uncharacterized protein [Procambarus clarkii]|uniref:uncharacterized protein isoform X3 n=1 Tax=Procambarus clarkii TaxID=6728 RepID=UPI003743952C